MKWVEMKENVTLSTTLAVPSQAKFHCFYVVNSCEKRVLKEIYSLRANVGGGVMSAS